jgi:hypothetical protein
MPHTGETIYSPTSFYEDKLACEVKAEAILRNWPKERYVIKHKCLEIIPEVIIDDEDCKK